MLFTKIGSRPNDPVLYLIPLKILWDLDFWTRAHDHMCALKREKIRGWTQSLPIEIVMKWGLTPHILKECNSESCNSSCGFFFGGGGCLFFFFTGRISKINLFFNWRIIALQNFVGYCQTSTWISHRYTYIPSLLNLPPTSLSIPPL